MSYDSNRLPSFKMYQHLLNEDSEFPHLNQFHFSNFSKDCLIKCGFISMIRSLQNDTLYLKLYYYPEKIRNHKREIENFVSSFYLHEPNPLNYKSCNLILIPIHSHFDIQELNQHIDIISSEKFLQSLLNENSWLGMNMDGTEGSLTVYSFDDKESHELHKQMLMDGFLEDDYEERLMKESLKATTGIRIRFEKFKMALVWDEISKGDNKKVTLHFKWKDHVFKLTCKAYYGERHRSNRIELEHLNKTYEFGVGIGTIGMGYSGKRPEINIGDYELKFDIGFDWVRICEISNFGDESKSSNDTNSVFQIVL